MVVLCQTFATLLYVVHITYLLVYLVYLICFFMFIINLKEMVKKKRTDGDDGGTLHWQEAATIQYLTLMGEYCHNNPKSKIPHRLYKNRPKILSRTIGRPVPFGKLTSKRDRFAKDYRIFKKLRDQSGLGWDPINCRFDCDDETWRIEFQVSCCINFSLICNTYYSLM